MRVLTYNIHKGIGGLDRRYEIDRTIDILSHFAADVILLQEVDHGAKRSRFHRQSELIARRLGFDHLAVGLNHRLLRGGAYGNVTLSRWPIEESFNFDISLPVKKKRGALYTRLLLPGGRSVHVCNVHLGLAHFERVIQVRRILALLEDLVAQGSDPTIIAGDSNDWRGKLCARLLEPNGYLEAATALYGKRVNTFPAYAPMFPLDRIYFRNIEPKRMIREFHTALPNASDHLPLVVEFVTNASRHPLDGTASPPPRKGTPAR